MIVPLRKSLSYLLLVPCFLFFCSCASTKKVVYFNNIQDSELPAGVENIEPLIQKNDLLSISVSSLNPEATKIFNTPNVTDSEAPDFSGRATSVSGYLVNSQGYIQFPILGNIKAVGLTKRQLKESLTKSLTERKLLVDPIINIRYLNYRVTVLGEVAHPTVVNAPNEKITLLEALGLAGDLTIYAKRSNVLIIREVDNKKIIKRINLNSTELFNSQYYYLQPNDIVYVEPDKAKVATASPVRQLLPLIFSGLTVVVVAVDRLTR
ncbi:sugar transporter [Rufibacter sp. DG15C]|uniref:polysaccharide biosynthesis/export family protein n=1 Tax=Rufibacter sp. DG15C TaxID=1379909 RepID=UPI00078BC027|nr:polysaccharide biosynthesis/export family protein [Rufibacter sp. DG15C]AMM51466.1 sugar transporter [Rufibacter sp. DG15C]